jgi:hypothetical protein
MTNIHIPPSVQDYSPLLYFLMSLPCILQAVSGCMAVVFFIFLSVRYVYSMATFLLLLRFNSEERRGPMHQKHMLYRSHQVLDVFTTEFGNTGITIVVFSLCIVQTADFYLLATSAKRRPSKR